MTAHALAVETGLTDLPDRIVVSPGYGRVSLPTVPSYTTEGEVARTGDPLAYLESASGQLAIPSPCNAWVLDLLVREGQQVSPGDPIVHIRAL